MATKKPRDFSENGRQMGGSFRIEVIRINEEYPMSIAECLRLERLTHSEKIQHWGTAGPWDGLKLPRNVPAIKTGHIVVDPAGNIVKMPPLIGRPCFGQVTAFLRHGGHQPFWNPVAKRWMNSRCMRCPARVACEYVVDERLRVTPEIEATYRKWRGAGGREAIWKSTPPSGLARSLYRDLLRLLKTTVQFTSKNDAGAISHYEAIIDQRRAKDRDRQQKKRLRQRLLNVAAGQFDQKVEEILNNHRIWRQLRHAEAGVHPAGPRQLKQPPACSSKFDAKVWLAKTRIELRGKLANDSNIASEMQSLGWELSRTHSALRDAVRRSLARVLLLERFHLPGQSEPIWPKFGPAQLRDALDWEPLKALGDLAA